MTLELKRDTTWASELDVNNDFFPSLTELDNI